MEMAIQFMEILKKKATFNLKESTHQGLKLAAAVQKREMVDLVEEAISMYFERNKMTKIENEELELYRVAESQGSGRGAEMDFGDLRTKLGYPAGGEVVAQLLEHVDSNRLAAVEINDGRTGYRNLTLFPDAIKRLCTYGGMIRLQLTIPGRQRFEQLQARKEWEEAGTQLDRWRQKAVAFRLERISALEKGQSFVPLADGPIVILHCIPLESFGIDSSHDVATLSGVFPMYQSRLNAWGPRVNLEGSICVSYPEPSQAYTEIYRNGAIEAVRTGILSSSENPLSIPSLAFEEAVITYLPHCFQLMRLLGCTPPLLLGLSLIGVKGRMLAGARAAIDRDVLVLPHIIVEDLSTRPSSLLKRSLDIVWNACGSNVSPYFDNSGNWIGRAGTGLAKHFSD